MNKIIPIVTLFLLGSCGAIIDKKHVGSTKNHPIRHIKAWEENIPYGRLLAPMVYRPSGELLRFAEIMNRIDGFEQVPRATDIDEGYLTDFVLALDEIPHSLMRKVRKKLLAIFLVKNLGSSAVATSVFDGDKKPAKGFILLDIHAIDKKVNQWGSWRERSVFGKNWGQNIRLQLANKETNDRKSALQYILLHEFGHVLSIGTDWHPPLGDFYFKGEMENYSFAKISWKGRGVYPDQSSRHLKALPFQNFIQFYRWKASPDLRKFSLPSIYSNLGKTNYPTLYSVLNVYEDFAESFANFVYVKMLNKPYQVQVKGANGWETVLSDCWNNQRCPLKKAFFERYFMH